MELEIADDNSVPNVIEIIRRINEGSTQPYLCKCDDGRLYVLKSKPSMPPRNLLAEFISGCLADDIGLPLPDFKIVFVPEELIEYMPDLQREICTGHAFASQYIDGAVALTFTQSRNEAIVPIAQQKLIYLFDKLVLNADRTLTDKGGNVNILYDVGSDKYYLIDHNLSFDQNVQPEDFAVHVYGPGNRGWEYDLVDRVEYRQKIAGCTSKLPEILENIPDDWAADDEFLPFVSATLAKGNCDDFWSEIA
ncbi:HipA family kinase [Pantoea vagans]|uniref:HipA family kinase n=1 Tax=Pantoea vagans TaxID=470934 RepID=UPI003B028DA5